MQKWKIGVLVGYIFNAATLPTIAYSATSESLETLNSVYTSDNDTGNFENNAATVREQDIIKSTDDSLYTDSEISKIRTYLGVNFVYGIANFHDMLGDEVSEFAVSNTSIETSDFFNTNSLGVNFNLGAQINKYLAIESFFQYIDSKHKEFEIKWDSPGYYYDINHIHTKMQFNALSIGIDALGFLPITNTSFSLVGSFGIGYYETRWKSVANNWGSNSSGYTSEHYRYSGSGKENYLGFRFGLGWQYDFSDSVAIRLMLKYAEINSDKSEDLLDGLVDISVGLRYTF